MRWWNPGVNADSARSHELNKNAEELEYGLIVLWEMLENQAPLLEGREADIFSLLLQIRYCAQMTVCAVCLGSVRCRGCYNAYVLHR